MEHKHSSYDAKAVKPIESISFNILSPYKCDCNKLINTQIKIDGIEIPDLYDKQTLEHNDIIDQRMGSKMNIQYDREQ